jgi:hypothetical protein
VVEEATSNLGARVRFSASATDQVDGLVPVACSPSSGASFPLGATLVTCSAVDRSGYTALGDFLVAVLDTRPPAIKLPGDLIEEATSKDGAQVAFSALATDLVDGSVPVTCTPASDSTFPLGATAVNCSASDAAGSAATRDFSVRVRDTNAPDLTLPGDLLVRATSKRGAEVTYRASASDVVDGAIDPTCAPASGELFGVGGATVNCSAADKAGNKATGSFTVTVEPRSKPGGDVTPPVLKLPKDMTMEATSPAGATVTYAAAATDLVDPTIPVTCTPTSGSTFPLGTITVDCSTTDDAGNKATGSFRITVQDRTAPGLISRDLTVEAASSKGTEVRSYPMSAVDLVDGKVLVHCPPGPPRAFPLGDSTVDCSATDKAGNKATGSFTVTVRDTTAPEIPEMPDIPAEARSPAGAQVDYQSPDATDRVDGPVPLQCTPAPGTFPLGTTTVICSATDKAGNKATDTFKVTVQDTTGPTITAPNQVVEAQSADGAQVVAYRGVSAVDLVDGPVTPNCSPEAPLGFRLGETTVDCTASDVAGNKATPASFKVMVEDTTPPDILRIPDTSVKTDSSDGTTVEYETPAATDTVDHDVTVTCAPASNQLFKVGTTTVKCTATDDAGNQAERGFNVTVELTYGPNGNPDLSQEERANPRAR